jgi:hypothetical protein
MKIFHCIVTLLLICSALQISDATFNGKHEILAFTNDRLLYTNLKQGSINVCTLYPTEDDNITEFTERCYSKPPTTCELPYKKTINGKEYRLAFLYFTIDRARPNIKFIFDFADDNKYYLSHTFELDVAHKDQWLSIPLLISEIRHDTTNVFSQSLARFSYIYAEIRDRKDDIVLRTLINSNVIEEIAILGRIIAPMFYFISYTNNGNIFIPSNNISDKISITISEKHDMVKHRLKGTQAQYLIVSFGYDNTPKSNWDPLPFTIKIKKGEIFYIKFFLELLTMYFEKTITLNDPLNLFKMQIRYEFK